MRLPILALACLATACTMESKFANDAKKIVHVSIAHDGATTIDGKPAVGNELTTRAHENENAHFVVDAEREVSYGVLLGALERLRAGGATDIALGVILGPPAPTGPAPGPTPPPASTHDDAGSQ